MKQASSHAAANQAYPQMNQYHDPQSYGMPNNNNNSNFTSANTTHNLYPSGGSSIQLQLQAQHQQNQANLSMQLGTSSSTIAPLPHLSNQLIHPPSFSSPVYNTEGPSTVHHASVSYQFSTPHTYIPQYNAPQHTTPQYTSIPQQVFMPQQMSMPQQIYVPQQTTMPQQISMPLYTPIPQMPPHNNAPPTISFKGTVTNELQYPGMQLPALLVPPPVQNVDMGLYLLRIFVSIISN